MHSGFLTELKTITEQKTEHKMSAKTTITIDFFGENYEVTYTISKYRPATYWQPEEGGDIELISVYNEDDTDILEDLTDLDIEIIIDKIADYERN